MSNDELQKAIDDITRDNAMPVAPEVNAEANEALVNEITGGATAPTKGEGLSLNPLADLGTAPAPTVPEAPGMPPVGGETQAPTTEVAPVETEETAADGEKEAEVKGIEEIDASRGEALAPVEAFSAEQADNLEIGGESGIEKTEVNGDDIEKIERAAMRELYPLLAQVSLSAEEKFEICMKVASDEPRAISGAFEAAKRIQNEKAKAEALLRIVKFKK